VIDRWIANAVLVLHFAFIAFVLGGGFLARRRPRIAWVHAPSAIWGALVEIFSWTCPLTPLEDHFRGRAGRTGLEGDFIERYLLPLIYPDELTPAIQLLLGAAVVAINAYAYAPVLRRRQSGMR